MPPTTDDLITNLDPATVAAIESIDVDFPPACDAATATLAYNGAALRRDRDALGWTQARLAAALGYATNTIAQYERGDRPIERPRLLMFALRAIQAMRK